MSEGIRLDGEKWRALGASVIEVYHRRFTERSPALHESILAMRRAFCELVPRERWGEFVDQPAPARPCFSMTPEAGEVAGEFTPAPEAPVPLLLFCPNCGEQHVDEAKPGVCEACGRDEKGCAAGSCLTFTPWLNPPHKSHRCTFCNHVWRPADVPTEGVLTLTTRGSRDGNPRPRYFATAADFERAVSGASKTSD